MGSMNLLVGSASRSPMLPSVSGVVPNSSVPLISARGEPDLVLGLACTCYSRDEAALNQASKSGEWVATRGHVEMRARVTQGNVFATGD